MPNHLHQCESHFHRLLAARAQTGGALWPSVLNVRTGRYPEGEHVPRRVYRLIGGPRGSTLYWDQALLVAAYELSEMTGNPEFGRAADQYVDAFLNLCVADSGLFRWGNHVYYDVFERKVIEFHGGCHELRPITPAWEVFWRHAPQRTGDYIRLMVGRHLYDPATGAFNRHDDRRKGHAFIEAGGVLCESAAWLFSKTQDHDLLDTALRIARYSYGHRDRTTGLVPNEPDHGRWDSKVSTSEVGLWAQCLLRAQRYTNVATFGDMALQATRAYLDLAFDGSTSRYFGQVGIRDGAPVVPEKIGYWPRHYADPWNTDQWPNHDYPAATAEVCLTLHALTGDMAFLDHARRWAAYAMDSRPGQSGKWAYAESYGQWIHFLTRAGRAMNDGQIIADARTLADEAVGQLYSNGMFQGYPGSDIYEAVDGVGYLVQALMDL